MDPTIFVITDLGFGDACKGSIVHYLTHITKAATVVRTGGCQALHNVITEKGNHHCHVHFGSGTFAGAGTYLSKHMVIDPYGIFGEGNALQKILGSWVYDQLAIDKNCLAVTPWHRMCNRLRELSRGENLHGSVGAGIGETVSDSLISEDLALYVYDFGKNYLTEKLSYIRQHKIHQVTEFLDKIDKRNEVAQKELKLLNDETIIKKAANTYINLYKELNIVGEDYLGEIFKQSRPVIFEPSQGVLLDQDFGFYPYNTFVNTTSSDALRLIESYGYQDQIIRLGLIRAYQHRHGAGPFVTEDEKLTSLLLDKHNDFHPWQRGWRVGHLDMIMLRYAINICGGNDNFYGLAVSCLDRIDKKNLPLGICCNYKYIGKESFLDEFFQIKDGLIIGIKIYSGSNIIEHQERLCQLLNDCRPVLIDISDLASNNIDGYLKLIEDQLGVNISIESFGPTESNKISKGQFTKILLKQENLFKR